MSKKLLYIAPHRPGRSPGQRFRFEQYIEFLSQQGFDITYSYAVNAWGDKILYQKGKYLLKVWIGLKTFLVRLRDWYRANNFDIILVYREAQFLGNTFFEKRFAKSKAKLAFDFDDAIWLNDTSDGNRNLKWLKKPEKINKIIEISDLVMAGNSYLAEYAKIFNENVQIIPTSINTDIHKTSQTSSNNPICIGWTGSSTTIKHFYEAVPFLKILKDKYNDQIIFKVIVDVSIDLPDLDLKSTIWTKKSEIEELDKIDIGIMPLPDDKWSRGKCGFKGIQYMALEKPTVMSPVGVNVDIIEHGKNGYLANTDKEWIAILSLLIDSEELRKTVGKAGRKTIVEKFSVDSQKEDLAGSLDILLH
ncbi:MAG: glycosyltransferase family 4 protein [Salinivirgaceae bacterium]|nr:glycosyltransferase family 4 protein [Salinivirgaceae bacterium]